MNGLDFMEVTFAKAIHTELKKLIKGAIYVNCDMNGDCVEVDITNGDLRSFYKLMNLNETMKTGSARSIAKEVAKRHRITIEQQFFMPIKNKEVA